MILKKQDLRVLSEAIAQAEKKTSGEIRVVVRHKRHWRERKLGVHEIAQREFHRLRMHHTKHRSGVLIMLLLSDRQFHIAADEGIHRRVADGTWDRIAEAMTASFREGKFVEGLSEAIREVGHVLSQHFPRLPDDRNELSDEIVEER